MNTSCSVPNKYPWALEIHCQKTGVGAHKEKPVVHIICRHTYLRIINNGGGGRLHGDGCLLGRIYIYYSLSTGKYHESVASIVPSAVGTSDNAAPDE